MLKRMKWMHVWKREFRQAVFRVWAAGTVFWVPTMLGVYRCWLVIWRCMNCSEVFVHFVDVCVVLPYPVM